MFYCVFYLQFYENRLWNVASAGLDFNTANNVSTEIAFTKPNDTAIGADFEHKKSGYVPFY